MCGHATIALGRWAVDSGRVAMMAGRAAFGLETPCGLLAVEVDRDGGEAPLVSIVSAPSFARHSYLTIGGNDSPTGKAREGILVTACVARVSLIKNLIQNY